MLTTIMIGSKILEARKRKKMSQSQLAQLISISSQAVGKWERGESMPDIIMFDRVAEVLGVDLNYFSENFPSSRIEDESTQRPTEKSKERRSWDMSEGNWVDADFSGLNNLHDKFSSSNMQRCLFIGSELSGLLLKGNNVDSCDFSESDISNSRIHGSNIVNSKFQRCSLQAAEISGSQIKDCDFSGANFTDAVVNSCSFLKNRVAGALWVGTAFSGTQFTDVVIEGTVNDCSFENCAFTKLVFQNATLIDTFFKGGSLKRIRFIDCKADKMTYAFLKSGKADMTGVALLEP